MKKQTYNIVELTRKKNISRKSKPLPFSKLTLYEKFQRLFKMGRSIEQAERFLNTPYEMTAIDDVCEYYASMSKNIEGYYKMCAEIGDVCRPNITISNLWSLEEPYEQIFYNLIKFEIAYHLYSNQYIITSIDPRCRHLFVTFNGKIL